MAPLQVVQHLFGTIGPYFLQGNHPPLWNL
jgi:hypothetical protein